MRRWLPLGVVAVLVAGLCSAANRAPKSEEVDLSSQFAQAREGCFVLLDLRRGATLRFNAERCAKRFPPCSTFKIPNSLIGLETGVIRDLDHRFRWDGVARDREVLNQDHTLRTAVKDSVVWYFQELARGVGQRRMQRFVDALAYGNRDLSGGLDRFWLESSMTISADEQVEFLRRLMRGELPFSKRTMELGREAIVLGDQAGTVFRGKTGSAREFGEAGDLGWFVGAVTGPEVDVVFACNADGPGVFGPQARRITEAILAERKLWPPPPPPPAVR